MKVLLRCIAYSLVLGVCLGTAAIRAQIVNPTYAILTLEHYRAYYSFYMLGDKLDDFARLGVLAAALVGVHFLIVTARSLGLAKFVRYSEGGERFSWPWHALAFCSTLVVGELFQVGLLLLVGCDLVNQPLSWYHKMALVGLFAIPFLAGLRLRRAVPEHNLLLKSIGILVLSGLVLAVQCGQILYQLPRTEFLVVPFLSTHYGPWGILLWVIGLALCLGLACGVALLGITPRASAEPDSLDPVERKNFAISLALAVTLATGLLSLYPIYLVPRFQIGQDFRDVLQLEKSQIPGRTVLFLDRFDPPHTLGPSETWSTPDNLAKVQDWFVTAPSPSALTRPASKILADYSLWLWRPEDALDWLEVHRRRLRYSNLNRAFLVSLSTLKPDPTIVHHLDSLLNQERFAWPGPGSRLELAQVLERYGRDGEADNWSDSARPLGGELLETPPTPPSGGAVRGRLLLDGEPLAGVRVALFLGEDREKLLARTRRHVDSEQALIEQSWRPTYYQYLDFRKLLDFYAVGDTDAEGRFLFEGVEPGILRLAVRLPQEAQLTTSTDLVVLDEGVELDIGTFGLTTGP
jgi:hypothetical protein